jgi:hypothetical protein
LGTDWFTLSLKDGKLKGTRVPGKRVHLHWSEWDIENLIALNPSFIDVADHLPLRLGGIRGTYGSPDQVYVDELGRIVVVEVKSITAGLNTIAQAIAYADHWRLLPPGEVGEAVPVFLHERKSHDFSGSDELRPLTRATVRTFDHEHSLHSATDVESFARRHWGDPHLPHIGGPARIIVIAPDFSGECTEFAESLAERMVGLELVRVSIVKARERICVGRRWVHRDQNIERTWRLLRHAWRRTEIREHFAVNGWADGLRRGYFSLSAREAAKARFWFWASDSGAEVCTCFPDNWYKDDPWRRKRSRQKFLGALRLDLDRSPRWLEWEFQLPAQQRHLEARILAVANAIQSVLVGEAPTRAAG